MAIDAIGLTGLFVGYVADITTTVAAIGLIGLTALPVLALGIVLIRHERKKPALQRNRYNTVGGVVLVVLALAAVAPRLWVATSQTPAPAPTAAPTAPAKPPPGRPRIVNNTSEPITIAIANPSAVRLLVTGKQIDQRWSPPPRTARAGDRPTLVQCNGRTFWAIPPNVPHDAVRAGDSGYYTGFATTWDGTELGAGQSYFRPLQLDQRGAPIQESDLVFQVPLDDGQATIYGLAVLETKPDGAVLGVAPFTEWGPSVDPSTF